MRYPTKITVLVDSREQYPLLFPKTLRWHGPNSIRERIEPHGRLLQVTTETRKLRAGDYCLAGQERSCIVERKGSLLELHSNLFTADRVRFIKAMNKLIKATDYPVMVLELSVMDLNRRDQRVQAPDRIFDALMLLGNRYPTLTWWFAGGVKHATARRVLGEQVIRMMLAKAYLQHRDLRWIPQ